jgi:predicted phosphoribosyltransferase
MFRDREDAALQLAECLKGRPFEDPLVLAIPRGGVVVGAVLARELGADLDVVLTRRLRAPGLADLTVGQFYDNFGEVDDQQVARLLQQSPAFARSEQATGWHTVC